MGADCAADFQSVCAVDHAGADRAAAFREAHDRDLVGIAASAGVLPLAGLLLDERLIGFHNLASAADRGRILGRGHRLAYAVSHEPCRLVRDPEHPVELVGADAFLGRGHQMRRQKPFVQGDMRPLENSARADRELAPASVAKEHSSLRLSAHLGHVLIATERANRAIRPTVGFHVCNGGGFVRENRVCQIAGHWFVSYDQKSSGSGVLSQVYNRPIIGDCALDVGIGS